MLLTRLKDQQQRLAYAQSAIQHGLSRNMLDIHIESRLLERSGMAVTNFEAAQRRKRSTAHAELIMLNLHQ